MPSPSSARFACAILRRDVAGQRGGFQTRARGGQPRRRRDAAGGARSRGGVALGAPRVNGRGTDAVSGTSGCPQDAPRPQRDLRRDPDRDRGDPGPGRPTRRDRPHPHTRQGKRRRDRDAFGSRDRDQERQDDLAPTSIPRRPSKPCGCGNSSDFGLDLRAIHLAEFARSGSDVTIAR